MRPLMPAGGLLGHIGQCSTSHHCRLCTFPSQYRNMIAPNIHNICITLVTQPAAPLPLAVPQHDSAQHPQHLLPGVRGLHLQQHPHPRTAGGRGEGRGA